MTKRKPIYVQIQEDLLEGIQSQTFAGGRLPTESDLCGMYQVSRMTVNKALSNLASAGHIVRKQGKGSFVRPPSITKVLSESRSFSNDMKNIGSEAGSRLLTFQIVKGKDHPEVAHLLQLEPEVEFYFFERLRLNADVPIAISRTYINKMVIPELPQEVLSKSLYEYLSSEYGIRPKCSDYIILARFPSKQEETWLGCQGEALLQITHLSFTQDGTPLEHNETSYLGSRYKYVTSEWAMTVH